MAPSHQNEINPGIPAVPLGKAGLSISASPLKALTPAQLDFNKCMKSLEKARAAQDKERQRLEKRLSICRSELMPLVERVNQANHDLAFAANQTRQTIQLTARRKKWLCDLISVKASSLLNDPVGLSDEQISGLEALVEELGPSVIDEQRKEMDRLEFEEMRDMIEGMARMAGVDLDLDGLDIHSDPDEFDRQLRERFDAAHEHSKGRSEDRNPSSARKRKPSKAAIERERRQQAIEEAKNRDIKSLYKQLAKVLHPDLETDPTLKAHKEAWMKRLTTAHSTRDLRDMLQIEMEWLGEEASNLAQASDEKLAIYAMVLKEQAAEIREQTRALACEPQYQTLARFTGPFGKPVPVELARNKLTDEVLRLEEMLELLNSGGPNTRAMLCKWADNHARACTGR